MFQADVRASVMGYKPPNKRLTPMAVPTTFSHCPAAKKRPASIQRTEVRTKKELIRPVSSCSFGFKVLTSVILTFLCVLRTKRQVTVLAIGSGQGQHWYPDKS